ncbi:hypothetical protein SRABI121_01208 [Microbacterium sp. Bi121]|nr:hypothetical protein SRABI121_01208 [Microbacterium sp. Bi121]
MLRRYGPSTHVRRTPHPTDRRAVLVELTDSARETMATMQREHVELNETLLSAITPDDRRWRRSHALRPTP